MEVGNMISKLEQNAETLGAIAGFLAGHPNGMNDIESIVNNALGGNFHAPNIQEMTGLINQGYVRTGALAAVGGYIIKEIDLDSKLTRLGEAIMKLGIGYAIGSVGFAAAYSSTHSINMGYGVTHGETPVYKSSGENPFARA